MPPTRNADMKGTRAYAAVMFVVISVISGLLLSGLLVPFVAVGGAGANAIAEAMNNLPAEFEAPDQFQGSKLVLADGTLLATVAEQDRKYVTLDQVNPLLRKAQIAIEDHRFYQHGALDFRGFMRALIKGGGGQGGSTLSQQYVKQVQIQIALDSGDKQAEKKAQERTLSRKVQELRRAMSIERKYSKDQILERYLNIAYYGDGSYGVESAAQHYFGVSAKDVTLEQAALIAGMVQNPSATDPVNHPKAALERRDMVLQRMVDPLVSDELAKIAPTDVLVTKEQAEKAQAIPFDKTKVKARADGCVASPYPFICDYATRELLRTTSLRGTSSNAAEARQNALNILNRKGLTIKLSVDNRFQESATRHLNEFVAPTDPVIGTMSSVEPGTGRIIMMAQSRPTMGSDAGAGETFYNYNVSEAFGGAEGYQAASTFKIFAAAAAFDKGIPMSKIYNSPSPMNFGNVQWDRCDGTTGTTPWNPVNYGDFSGTIDMKTASARSVNTYFIQLLRDAGMCNTAKMADAAGIELSNGETVADYAAGPGQMRPSFVLGSVEVSPLSLSTAYATWASRGIRCAPRMVDSIVKLDGTEFATNPSKCEQTVKPEVADAINGLLNNNIKSSFYSLVNARLPVSGSNPKFDLAGKTGTTDSQQTGLFVSYTPDLSTQILVTTDKMQAPFLGVEKPDLRNARLKSGRQIDAGSSMQPTAVDYYKDVLPLTKASKFTAAHSDFISGKDIKVPTLSCQNLEADEKALKDAGISTQRINVYSDSPVGTYLCYTPGGGSIIKSGQAVQMRISSGRAPAPAPAPSSSAAPSSAPPSSSSAPAPSAPAPSAPKPS